jgi:glyoxylase-like metal-dependent hydrolase (beta-lactamase superfamily II)
VALRIQPLHVGTVFDYSRAAVTYQRGYTETAEVVFIMFLITGGEHPVLVDTGTGTVEQVRQNHGVTLVRPPEQEPLAALTAAGVAPEDIGTVINTHLHWDHSSNNDLFPNADIVVQKAELAYAVDPLEPNQKSYERRPGTQPGWIRAIGSTRTVQGDTDLLPGISLVHLPGHTPGSQGVVVDGRYLIAGDCVSCQENWDGDALARHIPSGSFTNLHDYMDSFAKIERLDCLVIPSHDPAVLKHDVFE